MILTNTAERTADDVSPDVAPSSARRPRVLKTLTLTLAAAAGAIVLLASLAPLAGMRLVRLETGSMAPGLPAGSVLLARDVAATEVGPGDIVTVMRSDGSPVTHRVVEAAPAGDGARLVLRGDANDTPDPSPYLVTRVGLVVGGIPFGGQLADAARAPWATPVLAIGVSLLVLWAWWPERRTPAHRADPRHPVSSRRAEERAA